MILWDGRPVWLFRVLAVILPLAQILLTVVVLTWVGLRQLDQLLTRELKTVLPGALGQVVSIEDLSYRWRRGELRARGLRWQDDSGNFQGSLASLRLGLDWRQFLEKRSRLRVQHLLLEEPVFQVGDIQQPIRFEKQLALLGRAWATLKERFSSPLLTKFLPVQAAKVTRRPWVLKKLRISKGQIRGLDHQVWQGGQPFVHRLTDVNLEIQDLANGNWLNSPVDASLRIGGWKQGPLLEIKGRPAENLEGGYEITYRLVENLDLRKYNPYLSPGGFSLKAGELDLDGYLTIAPERVLFGQSLDIYNLQVKKKWTDPMAFFQDMMANPVIDQLKDSQGRIRIRTGGATRHQGNWPETARRILLKIKYQIEGKFK